MFFKINIFRYVCFKECKTYKILVERPLVLILVVVATIQMWKIPKNGALV